MRRLIAAYPTEKHNRTTPLTTNAAGVAGPAPRRKASGTMPTMAAIGAAAATTKKTIFGVVSPPRRLPAGCGAAVSVISFPLVGSTVRLPPGR